MNRVERELIWCELRDIYTAIDAHTWLETPHGMLDNRRPRDCGFDEVLRQIDSLKSGAFT
jgi:uncharacterized protein (DUF2384 family)